jgi:hypothetical protein
VLKRHFSVNVKKTDGTWVLRDVFDRPKVGTVIKIPVGDGQFVGIEITAEPSPGKPAEAKVLVVRKPDDPGFDPKSEPMDLITLALGPGDGEEKRFTPTSDELTSFFVDQQFSLSVAEFISMAVVQFCVSSFPKRKRGRPPRPIWEDMEPHAKELARIKRVLRANGEKGSVHKKAMQILQENYEEYRQTLTPDERRHFPPFPYDAIENYVRRAKKRSTK